MTRPLTVKIIYFVVVATTLISIGWYANSWYRAHFSAIRDKRVTQKGFMFISPLIDVELPEGYDVRQQPIYFKNEISKIVKQYVDSGLVQEVSVYFRDLSDGPWFGINENYKYTPASMMKVPIMAAWLKRAEKNPSVLQQKYMFDGKDYHGPPQGFKPARYLQSGNRYTVDELLNYMMVYSDNRALWLLEKNLIPGEYEYVLECMDVPNEQDSEGRDKVSIHSYSGFFRILYNATFLNKEMSEKALELMSHADFRRGIASGIPAGIKMSSKFGEYADSKNPTINQLHEFGIVYHPKGPYILGILTKGSNIENSLDFMKAVSKTVYESVNKQR